MVQNGQESIKIIKRDETSMKVDNIQVGLNPYFRSDRGKFCRWAGKWGR